jgi:hypothetical protein
MLQQMLQKEKKNLLKLARKCLFFSSLDIHSFFDNSLKQVSNVEASASGGGELFEKFQQKQKNSKDSTISMGGKR